MKKLLIIVLTSLFVINCMPAQDFKSVGYLPHYRFSKLQELDFSKLSHVNISFANPDMEGNIFVGDGAEITDAVELIHSYGAEVFIALAGGYLKPDWAEAWKHNMVQERRSAFISKIIDFAVEHNLDGIDMDIEWQYVDDLYSPFVLELADSLEVYNLTLTAALPGTYRYPEISDETLLVFEWLNMMAYDLRGPWNPSDPGPHSPYSFAVSSMNYWVGQGVGKERLTLGLPFYGYDFTDPNDTDALTYNQIVGLDPANAQNDQAGKIYYNGIPTIIEKTQLAISELSGIMIWEIGQDHLGEYSLLDAISETIYGPTVAEEIDLLQVSVSPNPFVDHILVDHGQQIESGSIQLYSMNGQLLQSEVIQGVSSSVIETSDLPSGLYTIRVLSEDVVASVLLAK